MPTNNRGEKPGSYPVSGRQDPTNVPYTGPESVSAGYETTDVNVGNVIVFLTGLFGFVLIFFVFCFGMGKVINTALNNQDGPSDKWHQGEHIFAGSKDTMVGAKVSSGKREDLKSNTAMEQEALHQMTVQFPSPRLDIDDGNQATADLHAKEDLLLEHYSVVPGQQGVRIPIERAMELVVQRGLPVAAPATAAQQLAGDAPPQISAPLTSGFARTGYELDTIEAREQKMSYGKAEAAAHAELKPLK